MTFLTGTALLLLMASIKDFRERRSQYHRQLFGTFHLFYLTGLPFPLFVESSERSSIVGRIIRVQKIEGQLSIEKEKRKMAAERVVRNRTRLDQTGRSDLVAVCDAELRAMRSGIEQTEEKELWARFLRLSLQNIRLGLEIEALLALQPTRSPRFVSQDQSRPDRGRRQVSENEWFDYWALRNALEVYETDLTFREKIKYVHQDRGYLAVGGNYTEELLSNSDRQCARKALGTLGEWNNDFERIENEIARFLDEVRKLPQSDRQKKLLDDAILNEKKWFAFRMQRDVVAIARKSGSTAEQLKQELTAFSPLSTPLSLDAVDPTFVRIQPDHVQMDEQQSAMREEMQRIEDEVDALGEVADALRKR